MQGTLLFIITLFIMHGLSAEAHADKTSNSSIVRLSGRVAEIFPERKVGKRILRYILLKNVRDFHQSEAMLRLCHKGCEDDQLISFEQLYLSKGQDVTVIGRNQSMEVRGRLMQSPVILAEEIHLLIQTETLRSDLVNSDSNDSY